MIVFLNIITLSKVNWSISHIIVITAGCNWFCLFFNDWMIIYRSNIAWFHIYWIEIINELVQLNGISINWSGIAILEFIERPKKDFSFEKHVIHNVNFNWGHLKCQFQFNEPSHCCLIGNRLLGQVQHAFVPCKYSWAVYCFDKFELEQKSFRKVHALQMETKKITQLLWLPIRFTDSAYDILDVPVKTFYEPWIQSLFVVLVARNSPNRFQNHLYRTSKEWNTRLLNTNSWHEKQSTG